MGYLLGWGKDVLATIMGHCCSITLTVVFPISSLLSIRPFPVSMFHVPLYGAVLAAADQNCQYED